MAYDFSSAINAATQTVNGTKAENGVKYPYPLVYVPKGETIVVKILFNPKSGQIARPVNRHDFEGNKVACYRTYGMECPICKLLNEVTAVHGKDLLGKSLSKTRGISFAQYMSSTNPIEVGGEGHKTPLKPGDIILFMYPWSVYTQINAMIQAVSQSPSGMERAFCTADEGLFLQIQCSSDYKYTTVLVPYMAYKSGLTNEQYTKMLDEMPNLNEQVLPSSVTSEIDAQVKETVNTIYKKYIAPRVPNQNTATIEPITLNTPVQAPASPNIMPAQAPVNNNNINEDDLPFYLSSEQETPNVITGKQLFAGAPAFNTGTPLPNMGNTVSQTVPVNQTAPVNGKPECYGQHQDGTPKCIVCPHELTCIQAGAQ